MRQQKTLIESARTINSSGALFIAIKRYLLLKKSPEYIHTIGIKHKGK